MKVLWVKKLEDIYKLGEGIGRGSYGKVYLATNTETKQKCVCKIVERQNDYVREVDHLICLRKCYGVLPIRQAIFTNSKLCMEFEIAECSLQSYLEKRVIERNETGLKARLLEALSITNQLLISISHIHANNIIHRDIKSSNVVITRDSDGLRAWVIDFGMSKRVVTSQGSDEDVSFYDIVTATYRAPEIWRLEDDNEDDPEQREYTSKIDVWSIGCILYEVITGECPFTGKNEDDIRKKIAGHIIYTTGKHNTHIYKKKINKFNVEEALEDYIESNFTDKKRSALRDSSQMDLCSSMEDMSVTPRREQLNKDIKNMLVVVKHLLRLTLQPDYKKRATAEETLKEFGNYVPHNSSIMESPLDLSSKTSLNQISKDLFMETIKGAWVACDHLNFNPDIVYLGVYLWIRCITLSAELCKEFSLSTLMMASMRIAISYTGQSIRELRTLRKLLSRNKDEKTPRRECNAKSSIMTLLGGRVWIKNPGDIRHHFIPHCEKGKWHTIVEKWIFSVDPDFTALNLFTGHNDNAE